MAGEKKIKSVLDMITRSSSMQAEALQPVAKRHAKELQTLVLDQENIVGVGIAQKVSEGKVLDRLALTFYVEKKLPLSELRADQAIPPTVPASLSGNTAVVTDVVVIGKLVPQVDPLITRHPVQPGYSIGHKNITAGTLGAVVLKGKDVFLLSNSHVLADSGKGKKGDAILYPGPDDGGHDPEDRVAVLEKFHPFVNSEKFVNEADCAIARPTPEGLSKLIRQIKDLGLPKGTIKPKRGMKIVKVGRTTRKTTGEIRDINFRTQITYEGVGKIGFLEQILCTRYSDGGDSGALVLDKATGKAVALHVAGSDTNSTCTPIGKVLQLMGVKLALTEDRPTIERAAKKGAKKKKTPPKKTKKR